MGPAGLVVETFAAAPGASVHASRSAGGHRASLSDVAGRLTHDPASPPVTPETPFDAASVTKPIVALTVARLERRGVLSRRERLADLVPEARGTASADVPLDLFLAHRAGLEAHIRLFEPLLTGGVVARGASLAAAADRRRAECAGAPPAEGFAPVYSDMGYLLVGAAIEARTGRALDDVVDEALLAPLGLTTEIASARRWRARDATFDARVAPTEEVAFRGGVVRGVVHDENAFAISGDGLSGHAGLFATARAICRVGEAVLDALRGESDLFTPSDLEETLRRRPGGSHRAGFDGRSGAEPASGTRSSEETFGHLGFTGTSLWIDPRAGFVGVLLSNRVFPTREHIAIRKARPAAYDAMFDLLERAGT